jgi:hypothetical protein
VECSTRLERWEGQAGAREYWFSAREAGHALALVAGGESYRQAARAARIAAGRRRGTLPGRRGRRRDPDLDGQLVANWTATRGSPRQTQREGAARAAPIDTLGRLLACYVHSSAAGAVTRWFSEPGGRRKVE